MTQHHSTADRPENYAELLEQFSGAQAEQTALIDDGVVLKFGELATDVQRVAAALAGLGVGAGDVVAVWLPNTIEWAETALAAGLLGAVTLGINTKLRSHDLQQLLTESGAGVLVTYPGFKGIDFLGMLEEAGDSLPATLKHIVHIRSEELNSTGTAGARTLVPWQQLLDAEPLEMQAGNGEAPSNAFTSSGTSGTPKIVLHNQRGILFHGDAVARAFGYRSPDAVIFATLPLCGVFGFNTMMAAFAAARPLVLQAVFNAEDALALIEQYAITHMNLADTMLRMMLNALESPERVSSWREAAFGNFTAADPAEMIRTGEGFGKKFFQTYGSSEVLALMTYPAAGTDLQRWMLGGGVPVSDEIKVRVRDQETGEPAGLGVQGEIEVKGPNVSCGLLTAGGIIPQHYTADNFFPTGDLGYLRTPDDVVYVARLGDALRLAGFLVSPREVEAFLSGLPGVREAQLIAVDGGKGAVPVAFIIPEAESPASESKVIELCQDRLAAFKQPKRVFIVQEFPMVRGSNGDKVQRNKLREAARELMHAHSGGRP